MKILIVVLALLSLAQVHARQVKGQKGSSSMPKGDKYNLGSSGECEPDPEGCDSDKDCPRNSICLPPCLLRPTVIDSKTTVTQSKIPKDCKECCKETCDSLKCKERERCVYKEVTCARAPCCPVAKCISKKKLPEVSCDTARCPTRCRLILSRDCKDTKNCVRTDCTPPQCSDYPFCPSKN